MEHSAATVANAPMIVSAGAKTRKKSSSKLKNRQLGDFLVE
jgi:hypothetical protein